MDELLRMEIDPTPLFAHAVKCVSANGPRLRSQNLSPNIVLTNSFRARHPSVDQAYHDRCFRLFFFRPWACRLLLLDHPFLPPPSIPRGPRSTVGIVVVVAVCFSNFTFLIRKVCL